MLGSARVRSVIANLVAAAACVLAAWWAFVVGQRVPYLTYVDLGFHQLGHLVFAWAPGLAGPLAGSIAQVGIPLGLALYFGVLRRDSAATALMLAWFATSAQNVSVYVVDKQFQYLPLVGNGQRDWPFIFSSLGHAGWAAPAAEAMRVLGLAGVILGLVIALVGLLPQAETRTTRVRLPDLEAERLAALPRREPRNRTLSATPLTGGDPPLPPWRMHAPH